MTGTLTLESSLGRLTAEVPEAVAASVRGGSALATRGFRERACRLARNMPYRKALGELGEECARHADEDRVTMHQITSTALREGEAMAEAARAEARRVLSAYGGFFGEDGAPVEGAELPEALRTRGAEVVTASPGEDAGPLAGLTVADVLALGDEEALELNGGPSEPYDGGHPHKMSRRTGRREVAPDERQARLDSRVRWRNGLEGVHPGARVLGEWELERDSSQVAFVSIDAVLVPEQAAEHVRGGRPEMRGDRTYVKHWDVRVDADGESMLLTSTYEPDAYLLLMGALVSSGLITRRLVFMVDGESRIGAAIERWFWPWEHEVYLDWYHVTKKVEDLLSAACVARRLRDPDAETEVYAIGPKKGQPKPKQKMASLSRLYARAASPIAWEGNAAALALFVRCIPAEDVKSERYRRDLLTYIANKEAIFAPWSLRRLLGLKNSSNGVEAANQMLVSARQKDSDLMFWRERGSAALATLEATDRNGLSGAWFSEGSFSLAMPGLADAA